MVDISNYETIKRETDNFYKKIGRVAAPVFNDEPVFFTSEGFNHLVYKGSNIERLKEDQITKFKLLGKALKLVQLSTTFQEFEESIKEFSVKKFKRRMQESRVVKYWGIIAIMGTWKIKVIIRQIGSGQKHFWSVIPNWTTNQYRDLKFQANMKGNPDED